MMKPPSGFVLSKHSFSWTYSSFSWTIIPLDRHSFGQAFFWTITLLDSRSYGHLAPFDLADFLVPHTNPDSSIPLLPPRI